MAAIIAGGRAESGWTLICLGEPRRLGLRASALRMLSSLEVHVGLK